MNDATGIWGLAAVAYLLGAIPNGFLVARLRGVDIRKVGSGNIGATNVFRCVGRPWGILTFVLDALKGFVPAWVFPRLLAVHAEPSTGLGLLYAALAVAGHNWPVYLGFRGGKGVATTTGALAGVAPAAVGIGAATWLAVFLAGRYVSLASIAAALAVGAASWPLYAAEGRTRPSALLLLCAVGVWRHRSNIRRLIAGTENRFGRRTEKTP